jgi:hypothetical protein
MMKLKRIGLAALAAMALTAFAASTASATTFEVKGVKKTGTVAISASLESGTSTLLQLTSGAFVNTCIQSSVAGATTTPFTAAGSNPIKGTISTLTFNSCTTEGVKVDANGTFSVEWIKGSPTNGTVQSAGVEVTVPGPLGLTNCKTGSGVDIGTLTGKATGQATLDINAVLNCGIFASSTRWTGSYVITSPEGTGVVE